MLYVQGAETAGRRSVLIGGRGMGGVTLSESERGYGGAESSLASPLLLVPSQSMQGVEASEETARPASAQHHHLK